MKVPSLTHERLVEILDYNPETGVFVWKRDWLAGRVAGWTLSTGYRCIKIDREDILAHRLAYFYVHRVWPEYCDHINMDRRDNRIVNLRSGDNSQSNANKGPYKNNTSGRKGVVFYKPYGKWMARITVRGREIFLGYFVNIDDAASAYAAAAVKYFGEFARVA